MKRKILAAVAAVCMTASSLNVAYAANIKTFINNGEIEYSGTVEKEKIGENVLLQVFNKGVEVNETSWKSENPANIVYINSKATDKDGNYSFNFVLTSNGLYPMVKNEVSDDKAEIEYIGYTNIDDFKAAITELSGKAENEIAAYIDANKEKLGMYGDVFSLPSADVAKLIKSSIKSDSDFSDLIKVYVAETYSQNKDVALNDYIDDILDENDSLKGYYKDYNASLYSAQLKQSYNDIDEFYDKLTESIILVNVYKNDGVSEVAEMLNKYASKLGITKEVTTTMASNVVGTMWTKTELADKLNKMQSGGSGGSASGSSWGGNNGGGVTSAVGMPTIGNNDSNGEVFGDIANIEWAKDAINSLFSKGVIKGKGDGVFAPMDNVLREEIVAMLVREIQLNITGAKPGFGDVIENAWYYDAVKAAYHSGIVNGYSEEKFGIGDNVTRQDLAVMIYNTLTICGIEVPETVAEVQFADEGNIAGYAQEAVKYLQVRGIINGYSDATFKPTNCASRAEVSVMLNRILPYTQLGK